VAEGDTLLRIAKVLREVLVGREVSAARGRPGGAELGRLVGQSVESVEARGKHLLISFSGGLTLHTHLGLHGSWHRYLPGEPWRRAPSRAAAVLEVPTQVCVCFDAPTVELMETRALALHPVLRALGPDVGQAAFDVESGLAALRTPDRALTAIGDALLDQRAVAGLGNVYRSELCFLERISPFTPVARLDDEELRRLLERGANLVAANSQGGARVTTAAGTPGTTYVYGRTGRPCRRGGTPIRSATTGRHARRAYWCPRCQP
jgi:endonuclease VIII